MGKVVINILPVGQGAMNLIEGYNESGELTDLLLIDMGNEMTGSDYRRSFDEYKPVDDSIRYVSRKMFERAKSSNYKRKLDLLFITHRDKDHYRFLEALFEPLNYSVQCSGDVVICKLIYDEYEDIYTAYKSNGEVRCERTRHFLDFYTANDPYICLRYHANGGGDDTASLFYKFHKIEISAHCIAKSYEEVSLEINLTNTGDCIKCENQHIKSRFNNPDGAFYVEGDCPQVIWLNTPYSSIWGLFNDWMPKLVDYLEYKEKEVFLDFFYKISEGIYKTVDDIIAISEKIPEDINKPIYKCVIGGIQSKAVDKMDILCKMSEEVISDSDPGIDILQLQNGTSAFRLLHYYNVSKMEQTFTNERVQSLSNATSAVGLFYETNITEGFKFLFPGDATNHTFIAMKKDKTPFELLKGSYWTAPHHGSAKTLYGLAEMLKKADIRKLFISAGYCNRHGHPNKSFIDDFTYAMQDCPPETAHDICINSNDWSRINAQWIHRTVQTPIYTVLECKGSLIGYVWHSFEYMSESPDNITYNREEYISSSNSQYKSTASAQSTNLQRKAGDPSPALFFRR